MRVAIRVLSVLDRIPPHSTGRHRSTGVAVLLVAYALLTIGVVAGWPLDGLDRYVAALYPVPMSSPLRLPVEYSVLIGDGVPASALAALYAAWRAWRRGSRRPVIMFGLALILLNVSVGVMKHATGRLSPQVTDQVRTVLAGGTIYPSGHAANAVVMFGLIAMLVPLARRRLAVGIAAVASVAVGVGTILVDTHWVSDVLGGWLAGALVLLTVPAITTYVEHLMEPYLDAAARWAYGVDRIGLPGGLGEGLAGGLAGAVAGRPALAGAWSTGLRPHRLTGELRRLAAWRHRWGVPYELSPAPYRLGELRGDPRGIGDRGADDHRIRAGPDRGGGFVGGAVAALRGNDRGG